MKNAIMRIVGTILIRILIILALAELFLNVIRIFEVSTPESLRVLRKSTPSSFVVVDSLSGSVLDLRITLVSYTSTSPIFPCLISWIACVIGFSGTALFISVDTVLQSDPMIATTIRPIKTARISNSNLIWRTFPFKSKFFLPFVLAVDLLGALVVFIERNCIIFCVLQLGLYESLFC